MVIHYLTLGTLVSTDHQDGRLEFEKSHALRIKMT